MSKVRASDDGGSCLRTEVPYMDRKESQPNGYITITFK